MEVGAVIGCSSRGIVSHLLILSRMILQGNVERGPGDAGTFRGLEKWRARKGWREHRGEAVPSIPRGGKRVENLIARARPRGKKKQGEIN